MLGDARTTADFDCPLDESIVGSFIGPDVGFARFKVSHFIGGKAIQGGIGLLDMLQPGGGVELVKDDLAG